MDYAYVIIALTYASTGLVYGYAFWHLLEVVDAYAKGLDT